MPDFVLIVDDEPFILDLAADLLRELGCHVITSHSADEASRLLDAEPRIATLLTDVQMPGLNGIELAARGSIETGAQNLPGNWQSSRFNFPESLCRSIPRIGDYEPVSVMHNDAVVQGLSEAPFMKDVPHGQFSHRDRPWECVIPQT